jgi:hypothetical protein
VRLKFTASARCVCLKRVDGFCYSLLSFDAVVISKMLYTHFLVPLWILMSFFGIFGAYLVPLQRGTGITKGGLVSVYDPLWPTWSFWSPLRQLPVPEGFLADSIVYGFDVQLRFGALQGLLAEFLFGGHRVEFGASDLTAA